jgi:hypothetical protein
MNISNQNLIWKSLPGAEERLEELRKRDLEVANIAHGLQMRMRITDLENEIHVLRSIEKAWKLSRLSRLYFKTPSILRSIIQRIKAKL